MDVTARTARAPASSANLGPGFDVLAVALDAYVEVSVRPADRLVVTTRGHGSDLPADRTHLGARIAAGVIGHDRFAIEVSSDIPVGRGLGSSAALAVAAAAAAGHPDPFQAGVDADGHAENAAASAFGGLVAATMVDGAPVCRHLTLDPDLAFVVLVPDRVLLTKSARAALPPEVSHADATFNLGRLALMIAGLADARELVAAAGDDRLHQGPRSRLFPEAPALLDGLRRAGALTSCWSGAGPSLLAVCRRADAAGLAVTARTIMRNLDVEGDVRVFDADRRGVALFGVEHE